MCFSYQMLMRVFLFKTCEYGVCGVCVVVSFFLFELSSITNYMCALLVFDFNISFILNKFFLIAGW